jgi:very-short-patch-repair endonuclease
MRTKLEETENRNITTCSRGRRDLNPSVWKLWEILKCSLLMHANVKEQMQVGHDYWSVFICSLDLVVVGISD